MDMATTIETSALVALGALTLLSGFGTACAVYRQQRARVVRRGRIEQFESFVGRSLKRLKRRNIAAGPAWEGCRKFRIVWREYENDNRNVCSFYLVPADRRPLAPFRPGQHLTVEVPSAGGDQPAIIRQYSISSSPSESRYYRITVKRQHLPSGAQAHAAPASCSNFLHDHASQGAIVNVYAPSGDFAVEPTSTQPIVMIAGGVGLTPLLCMLKSIVENNENRSVWLLYGVRNGSEHILRDELNSIQDQHRNIRVVVFYSQPSQACVMGRDYDVAGRISMQIVRSLLMEGEYTFFVCGPDQMSREIVHDLKVWGVPDSSIMVEHFGSSASEPILNATAANADRDADCLAEEAEADADDENYSIFFAKSRKKARWLATSGSLLELAEAHGIKTQCSCRQGICGTCVIGLQQGEVIYTAEPKNQPAAGAVLPCIARPRSDLVLDL